MILIPFTGICAFEQVVSISQCCRFALAEIVFHWSLQFGFLDVSAGNVFGQVRLAIKVYFW